VQRVFEGEENKPKPKKTDFVYHVMNNTCIHLRAKGPNIYMYRRGEYTKNPLEKYNNRKSQYISNSEEVQAAAIDHGVSQVEAIIHALSNDVVGGELHEEHEDPHRVVGDNVPKSSLQPVTRIQNALLS
jgi:hypothetical protein